MSRSLNKAIIIGNLGADPEIRTTSSGTQVAQFSVATSRQWAGRDGEQQEKTEWHRIVAWAKLAEIAEKYLKKGERVYIEGEIQYRSYEDKDGVTKYTTEINAREMMMLGGREGGGSYGDEFGAEAQREPAKTASRGAKKERVPAKAGAGKGRGPDDAFDMDDDLPF